MTSPVGIACPLESYSPQANWKKGQSGGGGVHAIEEAEVGGHLALPSCLHPGPLLIHPPVGQQPATA